MIKKKKTKESEKQSALYEISWFYKRPESLKCKSMNNYSRREGGNNARKRNKQKRNTKK